MAADVGVFANLVTHEAYYLHHLFYNKMKSKNYQLMLLSGALTVSFAAHAAGVNNKSIV